MIPKQQHRAQTKAGANSRLSWGSKTHLRSGGSGSCWLKGLGSDVMVRGSKAFSMVAGEMVTGWEAGVSVSHPPITIWRGGR